MISGEFAIFSVLSARADIEISAQGFSGYLNKVGVAGVTIIDRIGGELYWYPNFSIAFSVRVDILDAIVGEGAIVARETEDGGFYFGGYASVTIKIPDKIWLIGGTKVGSAGVGIDTSKVWGSVKIIGIGVGVVYYWGGDVDISTGKKLTTPEPIGLYNMPVRYDEQRGQTLYMSVTNKVSFRSSTETLEDVDLEDLITSSADNMSHTVDLQVRNNEDALISVTYSASNRYMAEDIKNEMTASIGGAEYALRWYNNSYDADSEANKDTNAIFRYNEETKTAVVSFSVTDTSYYGEKLNIKTTAASSVELYTIVKSVMFDEVSINEDLTLVSLKGSGLEKLSRLSIYAADEDGALYPLGEYDTATITSDSIDIPVSIPKSLPTGNYTLKAIGVVCDDNGNETETPMADSSFTYVNPKQPKTPTLATIGLGGNYSLELNYNAGEGYDGIMASIYEVTEDGLKETVFSNICFEATGGTSNEVASAVIGGRTLNLDTNSGEGESYIGLEAGKAYVVTVQSYVTLDDGNKLLSVELTSNEITMVAPIVTNLTFEIENAIKTHVGTTSVEIDMVNTNDFTLKIGGGESVLSATYTLNGGEKIDWNGGDVNFKDLEDGTYTIRIEGVSKTNDAFSALYQFTVDTESPSMLISSPQGGGFFSGDSVIVTGISEAGARIEVTVLDSNTVVSTYADGEGRFSVNVPLDESYAYQEILVYAYDAAGNSSMPFGCTLTNDLLGDPDLEVVVLYNGREVQSLVCTTEAKQLKMALKSGNKYVTVNENSGAASRIEWSVQIIEKSASITKDGTLVGENGAAGIVLVSLDNKTAMVYLESVDLAEITVTPTIPEGGFVYDGTAKVPGLVFGTEEKLTEGEDYTVSYLNNVNAGVASAVILATENGKCVGTAIVNYKIARRNINEVKVAIELDEQKKPVAKLTFGDTPLSENVDYTVSLTRDDESKNTVIVIEGIGNFEDRVKVVLSDEDLARLAGKNGFNPLNLLWIIPLGALLIGGGVFGIITLKKKKTKKDNGSGADIDNEDQEKENPKQENLEIEDAEKHEDQENQDTTITE